MDSPTRTSPPSPAPGETAVGLIGVGLLGSAMAARLVAAGYAVLGHDVDPAREGPLRAVGGSWAATPREVFWDCAFVLFSLPTSSAGAEVIRAAGDLLRPEHLIIDTTTGSPEEMTELAETLRKRGIRYVDASISGSSAQARAGEVVALVGGSEADVDAVRPVLSAFAAQVFHVGPTGSGIKMKLVTNLVLGLHRAVLAEGLLFARTLGIEAPAALRVLRASAASSRVMEAKGEKMVRRDFTPQARLSQHLKDVRLILDAAGRAGTRLPLSALHAQLLEAVERAGHGEEDNSAILRAFE